MERIERLEEEKKAIAADIKEIYAEAKANGFDTKILRKVVGLRKKEAVEREEEEALIALYMHALGMAPDTTADAPPEPLQVLARQSAQEARLAPELVNEYFDELLEVLEDFGETLGYEVVKALEPTEALDVGTIHHVWLGPADAANA